jgi:hypothetical protein
VAAYSSIARSPTQIEMTRRHLTCIKALLRPFDLTEVGTCVEGSLHVRARVRCVYPQLRFVDAAAGRGAAVYAASSGSSAPIGRTAPCAFTGGGAADFNTAAHRCTSSYRCPIACGPSTARRTAHCGSVASESTTAHRSSSTRCWTAQRPSPRHGAGHDTSRRKSPDAVSCATGARKPQPTSDIRASTSAGSLPNTRASPPGGAPSPGIAGTATPTLARHARARSAA